MKECLSFASIKQEFTPIQNSVLSYFTTTTHQHNAGQLGAVALHHSTAQVAATAAVVLSVVGSPDWRGEGCWAGRDRFCCWCCGAVVVPLLTAVTSGLLSV